MDDAYHVALELTVAPPAGPGTVANRVEEDTGRFESFVRDQYPGLLQFLSRRSVSPEDAQDAAQESLARFVRYQSEPAAAWKPLLYRIAINVLNDRSRQAQSHHAHQHVPFEELDLESEQPTTEETVIQAQQLALLRAAILELPP
jgi:DNA-directed RNA polymerase specialized sigma24 family protein